eukprot:1140143-Pelagomonas_calceolata.AAC.2
MLKAASVCSPAAAPSGLQEHGASEWPRNTRCLWTALCRLACWNDTRKGCGGQAGQELQCSPFSKLPGGCLNCVQHQQGLAFPCDCRKRCSLPTNAAVPQRLLEQRAFPLGALPAACTTIKGLHFHEVQAGTLHTMQMMQKCRNTRCPTSRAPFPQIPLQNFSKELPIACQQMFPTLASNCFQRLPATSSIAFQQLFPMLASNFLHSLPETVSNTCQQLPP